MIYQGLNLEKNQGFKRSVFVLIFIWVNNLKALHNKNNKSLIFSKEQNPKTINIKTLKNHYYQNPG